VAERELAGIPRQDVEADGDDPVDEDNDAEEALVGALHE
jgi:hypothetical protein